MKNATDICCSSTIMTRERSPDIPKEKNILSGISFIRHSTLATITSMQIYVTIFNQENQPSFGSWQRNYWEF